MSGFGDALTKQVGPLPMGVWLLVGGGGLALAYKSSKDREPQLVQDVREVPVPVGAIGPADGAPVVITPIFRLPEVVNNITVPAGSAAPVTPPKPATSTTRPPAPAAPAPAAQRTHTVRSGDTLSALAARFYGDWRQWERIYRANAAKIDGIAASRGKAGGGHWIFPGTVLVIP